MIHQRLVTEKEGREHLWGYSIVNHFESPYFGKREMSTKETRPAPEALRRWSVGSRKDLAPETFDMLKTLLVFFDNGR